MQLQDSEGLTFHKALKTEFTKHKSQRFLSVEIEVESCNEGSKVNRVVSVWNGAIVEDGSLPDSGFEINTAPANGDLFVNQITEICQALKSQGAQVSNSCGLHIHVDARDFAYYDLRRLIKLYAAIEPALYQMVPPSRKENHYCIPCGSIYLQAISQGRLPKESKKGIIKSLYKSESTRGKRQRKYESCRYYALNLHSWMYRGTVECRLFNGTVDAEKITNWGRLWAAIVDQAMTLTEDQIDKLVAEDSSDQLLLHLAPTKAVKAWIHQRWAKWA